MQIGPILGYPYNHILDITKCWKKEIKQNKQPNNGQCCLFIVGVSTGFGHAMTFFKMKNKCQVVLKYKKTDRQCRVIMIVR